MNKKISFLAIMAIGLAASLGIVRTGHTAAKPAAEIKIVADDIGGVVTSSKGPEAGVWVIAETKDLPTGYRKIVVTDDQGRYVIPDLPKANYVVWARGYGLIDSAKAQSEPGKIVKLAPHLRASERIEGAKRLVHQDHRRICGKRARHPHSLALAPGKLMRVTLREFLRIEPNKRE